MMSYLSVEAVCAVQLVDASSTLPHVFMTNQAQFVVIIL